MTDDPEIERLAAIGRRRRQSGGHDAVLLLGERFRLDFAQLHLAIALCCDLGHQLAHAVCVRADRRETGAELARIDKFDLHGLDQPLHHAFRRCRERVEPVRGEVRARPAEPFPCGEIEPGEDQDCGQACKNDVVTALHHPPFLALTQIVFSASHRPMKPR